MSYSFQIYKLFYIIPLINLHVVNCQTGPQPCPENPIVLTGSDFPQFVYSPYDELRHYPPNTDCRFVLVARNLQRRIQINVIESRLEEPLFTDCKDYVSVRDGGLPTSQEITRWCGSDFPPGLTSTGDSLYVHFHSDNIIQSRGFNLSFTDYDMPGCPSDWISDSEGVYCYKLVDSVRGYTFADAQKACFYERANLLTIENSKEYTFIVSQYSASHSFPWIGYNDANREGYFEPIDPSVPVWPETFPITKSEHDDKDCIFLDWNVRDETAHTVDDCRNARSLICKKRQGIAITRIQATNLLADGTTVPIQLSSTLVRYGFQTSSFNYTLLILILILLVILLIILWIVYQKLKGRNAVAAVDRGPLVSSSSDGGRRDDATSKQTKNARVSSSKSERTKTTKTTTTDAVKRIIETSASQTTNAANDALQKTLNERDSQSNGSFDLPTNSTAVQTETNLARIHTAPNQPSSRDNDIHQQSERSMDHQTQVNEQTINDKTQLATTTQINNEMAVMTADRSHLYVETQPKTGPTTSTSTPLGTVLPPVGEPTITRDTTNVTGILSSRSRLTHPPNQTFERPHVGTLDNVSAISMDEFWQN
ncbi:Tolloid-like protein 1 [Aphelenchoides besseyi]|nr:Tolloid-like protein 1 [Aphelenchoides besseyi]KAI6201308.1 Tolloid-like protein 1 [Aphelenchoides besseyi]